MTERTPVGLLDAEAVVFDLDGVITDTAAVHRRAWAELFSEFLTASAPKAAPYTDADYFELVDGKPRADGVRAVLDSRGVSLPEGLPDDDGSTLTVNGLGNRKNAVFTRILDTDGVQVFPGSQRLVESLRAARVPMAVVSSSRNARTVLERAGLIDYFSEVVDGQLAAQRGIPGKPAPDMFLTAARLLGISPRRSVAIEDATSGVTSAHRAGYWVVGVARGSDGIVGAAELTSAGADQVVGDPGELVVTGVA